MKLPVIATIFVMIPTAVIGQAQHNCTIDSQTKTEVKGTIDAVRNIERSTQTLFNQRICTVSLEAKIAGKWYHSMGNKVYSPDTSENAACEKAADQAKVDLLKMAVPQEITANEKMFCSDDTAVMSGRYRIIDDSRPLPWIEPNFHLRKK